MPSYSVISTSDTVVKLTEDTREYLYKKVYCSCTSSGDYVMFSTHEIETGLLKQQYKFLYTDCVSPTAVSASALVTAINAVIQGYAGGSGSGETINVIMAHIATM